MMDQRKLVRQAGYRAAASLFAVLFAGLCLRSNADEPLLSLNDFQRPVRVACVGDSITLGRGSSAGKNSYPAQLGRMLGEKWDVRNFGSGGAAALKLNGQSRSYFQRAELNAAIAFEPDVVIFEFGANDAVSDWPANGRDFVSDYSELMTRFAKRPSAPRLIVAGLLPVSSKYRYTGVEETARNEIGPLLSKVATRSKARFLELLPENELKPETLFDGIHPDAEGSGIMARHAYELLTGRKFEGAIPVPE